MTDRTHALPLTRQSKAIGISRGSVYYKPRPVSEAVLALMRQLDALHLDYPFAGARLLRCRRTVRFEPLKCCGRWRRSPAGCGQAAPRRLRAEP